MNRVWKWSLSSPALLLAVLAMPVVAEPAISSASSPMDTTIERVSTYNHGLDLIPAQQMPINPMSQVTSVTQLADVQPTDWAYQSLQSLVDRYGCIVGYPDGTFRGNRPLSRYEFAAGLNACLDKVGELIAQGKLLSI